MQLEITPEPTPEERQAIEKALAALAARDGVRPGGDRGEWWRQGLRDAVGEHDDAAQAASEPDGEPRRS